MFYRDINQFKEANGYEVNGLWYPRVTSIIAIKAKPALYKFYAEQASFASAEKMKNKSAEEGTLIHEVVEDILSGKKPEVPRSIRPAIEAFENFRKKNLINPKRVEAKIVSREHWYAGTLDVLAELNGRLGVLDIKTSQAIYRDYNIQTAAYVEALYEEGLPNLSRWILRIDQNRPCLNGCGATLRTKGGSDKVRGNGPRSEACNHRWGDLTGVVELKELTDQQKDARAFFAAKALWEWENDYWVNKL